MHSLIVLYTKLSGNDRSYLNLFDHVLFLAEKYEDFC